MLPELSMASSVRTAASRIGVLIAAPSNADVAPHPDEAAEEAEQGPPQQHLGGEDVHEGGVVRERDEEQLRAQVLNYGAVAEQQQRDGYARPEQAGQRALE